MLYLVGGCLILVDFLGGSMEVVGTVMLGVGDGAVCVVGEVGGVTVVGVVVVGEGEAVDMGLVSGI